MRIVYDRRYNLGFPGSQRLHPFDLSKFARAWRVLCKTLGTRLNALHVAVPGPVDDEILLRVHTPEYLRSLRQSMVIAQAVEVPVLRRAPWWLLNRFILQPMRWATAGTILAGRTALEHGLAFNLGGGFHHAKPDGGEGFSIYNDIAVLIQTRRTEGRLAAKDRIAYIDLDAHLGNGVAWCFRDDPTVFLFDMHNGEIYPMFDLAARERVDCLISMPSGTNGVQYLQRLRTELPPFLSSIARSQRPALAIYNAGTDVLVGDAVGALALSLDNVLARDQYVLELLRDSSIPTVVLASGGYTDLSYQAIARTILAVSRG